MRRELRSVLEAAQGRAKSLRDSLPSMNESLPLPEDLEAIERLKAESSSLETQIAATFERTALARTARDEAAREVLRAEPGGTLSHVGIPAALGAGLLSGLTLSWWWAGLPFSLDSPRLAALLAFSASAGVLLRSAWRTGRISGARGPR